MRKTLGVAAAALALLTGSSIAGAQASVKLGYVDTDKLMASAPGRDAAQAQYKKEETAFDAQKQKWSDSLKKVSDLFTKEEPKLTEAQKTARIESIQKLQADFQDKYTEGTQRLQARENELLAPLMEMVKKAIDDIREEGSFAIIFSADANSPIVSADKNLDITDRVMARLKTMPAKVPAPPSTMGAAAVKRPPPAR